MQFILVLTTFLHIVLALYVLLSSIKELKNISFGFFLIGISLWSFTNAGFQNSLDKTEMFKWAIWAYTAATFMLTFMFIFAKAITNKKLSTLSWSIFAFVSVISFVSPYIPNLVIVDVNFAEKSIIGGPMLSILFITYLYYIVMGMSMIYRSYRENIGIKKKQLLYVGAGLIFAIIAGLLTNLVLPALNNYTFVSIGPSFTLVSLSLVAYSIVRYKFLDIRLLLGRVTYFALAGSVAFFAFYIVAIFQITIFGDLFTLPGYFVGIINAIIFVMAYDTLIKFIRDKVDSTIINPGFDPDTEVSNFNNEVASLLDTNQINALTLDTFKRTVRLKALNLVVKEGGDVDIFSSEGDLTSQDIDLSIFQKLAGVFSESQKSINVDIFDAEDTNQKNPFSSKTVHECVDILKKFNIRLLVPLKQGNTVIGLLMLGPKEGDSPYNTIETDFAVSIASLVSLSLNRSFLYKEVEEFNSTLQKKVTEATSELQDKSEKLKQSLDYERDMLDILGHELRTPLSIARNAIMLIQMKMKAIPAAQGVDKEVGIAVENIRREVQLLETILASTKIDNDRLELQPEKIDAKKIIADGIRGYEQDALKKELKLTSEVPPEELFVYADKLRVQQVMDNLVSNAVKYTKAGEVKILMKDIGDMLEFKVQDTGEGIPEKDIPNLGTKFFRVNTYLESNGKIGDRKIVRPGGTGIGLYVVFQLVKAMGGTIVVTSKLGEGSTFTFTVPKYKEGMDATTGKLPSFMIQPKFT